MNFNEWFVKDNNNGKFYNYLDKLFDNPSYTEPVVGVLKEAYEQGQQDTAQKCYDLCREQSAFLLRFSQFGSNAASDCAKLIKDMYL